MQIHRYVTEWGFPVLSWQDKISNMTGMPQDPMPTINSGMVNRALWIGHDGVQMCALDTGRAAVAGHWDELQNLVIGSTRQDLTPEDARLLGMNRLRWVEHQTLEAHFSDGTVNRIAQSAVAPREFQRLHDAITKTFLFERPRGVFVAPETGNCWVNRFPVAHEPLETGEVSKTRSNVSVEECRRLPFWHELPIPSFEWLEPVTTKGVLFGGKVQHHLVQRLLYVGRGFREGSRSLSFNSYMPGNAGVLSAHADFALLKGIRMATSLDCNAAPYQPIAGTQPGISLVADFRYGLSLPLTCAWVTDDKVADQLVAMKMFLERNLMPLVGRHLSDEELGLPPKMAKSW